MTMPPTGPAGSVNPAGSLGPAGSVGSVGPAGPDQHDGEQHQGRRRRPDVLPKVILQAHATRASVAQALLLHSHERTARQLRKPLPALLTGVIVALIITVAFFIAIRLGSLPKN